MIMINKRIIAITAVLAFSLNALSAQGRFEYGGDLAGGARNGTSSEEQIELVEGLELVLHHAPMELEAEVSQDGAAEILVSIPTVLHESSDSKLQLSTYDILTHSCPLPC